MDDIEHAELEAAIAAHCQWLEQLGLSVPARPDHIEAWELFGRPWAVPEVAQVAATAVLSSLAALCAFRTREGISLKRKRLRDAARSRIGESSTIEKSSRRAHIAMVEFAMDESHITPLVKPLRTAGERVRTLRTATGVHLDALKKRHRKAKAFGAYATSLADVALTRWIQSRCRQFEADLEFFAGEVLGQEVVAHKGPTTAKAWHRLRGDCLLQLKDAQFTRSAMGDLFPPARPRNDDPTRAGEQQKRRAERDDKAIKRASDRRLDAIKGSPRTRKR